MDLADISYRYFIESVKDCAIYVLTPTGIIASWNAGARRIKQYTNSEIIGKHFSIFYSEKDTLSGEPNKNLALALEHEKFEGEGWRYRKDGSSFWALVTINAIKDENGKLLGYAKITRDNTEKQQLFNEISHMAKYDSLTGLPNRGTLFSFVENLMSNNNYMHLAICTIDIDKFKYINDTEGHLIGDKVLQIASKIITKKIRGEELVARFGGDEFIAIKPFNKDIELYLFLKKIEQAFNGVYQLPGLSLVINSSIGYSIYPQDGIDINNLISKSDQAMYRAKKVMSSTAHKYDYKIDEITRFRNEIVLDIKKGVKNDEFFICYQGRYSISTKNLTGYEALLRWNHPRLGLLLPGTFISIAESSNLIIPLGLYVFEKICQESFNHNIQTKVSINISPIQLRHPDFINQIRNILKKTKFPSSLIEFEVTETAFIVNKDFIFKVLNQLKGMGISIVLDDFGVGYSSLGLLRDFHFDSIKMDRSFMKDANSNEKTKTFIKTIIALSKSINIPLIAEGVESNKQLKLLEKEGCDEFQGFIYGNPKTLV